MENCYIKNDFGKIILPIGSILYCLNPKPFNINLKENFPFFFCFFHPSEYENQYITKIILKKNISLFFAIDFFQKILNGIDKIFIKNLIKRDDQNDLLHQELIKNNLDGWFCFQPRGKFTNIFLVNNPEIFEISNVQETIVDWKKEVMC